MAKLPDIKKAYYNKGTKISPILTNTFKINLLLLLQL